jgi:UDP-N-acetylglucosamine 4-epimerase
LDYTSNNVLGTHNVFEAARINKVKKVVYASSSSVYGDHPSLPKVEGIEGNLLSPYALSKKINEEYGKLYWEIYKLPTIGLRYFNVFGRRQNPEGDYAAVIPKFIKLIFSGQSPTVYGDGNQSRDFTYIDNVIQANLKALYFSNDLCYGKSLNIASGENTKINDLFYQITTILNLNINLTYLPPRSGDVIDSLASINNAKEYIQYKPTINFYNGLQLAINWYKITLNSWQLF